MIARANTKHANRKGAFCTAAVAVELRQQHLFTDLNGLVGSLAAPKLGVATDSGPQMGLKLMHAGLEEEQEGFYMLAASEHGFRGTDSACGGLAGEHRRWGVAPQMAS